MGGSVRASNITLCLVEPVPTLELRLEYGDIFGPWSLGLLAVKVCEGAASPFYTSQGKLTLRLRGGRAHIEEVESAV